MKKSPSWRNRSRQTWGKWKWHGDPHDRDAVYGYLAAVHNVVRKWKRERRAWKSAALA